MAPHVTHFAHCHCRAVEFSFSAPADLVAWDCNCSICAMKRNVHAIIPAKDLWWKSRADNSIPEELQEYRFGTGVSTAIIFF